MAFLPLLFILSSIVLWQVTHSNGDRHALRRNIAYLEKSGKVSTNAAMLGPKKKSKPPQNNSKDRLSHRSEQTGPVGSNANQEEVKVPKRKFSEMTTRSSNPSDGSTENHDIEDIIEKVPDLKVSPSSGSDIRTQFPPSSFLSPPEKLRLSAFQLSRMIRRGNGPSNEKNNLNSAIVAEDAFDSGDKESQKQDENYNNDKSSEQDETQLITKESGNVKSLDDIDFRSTQYGEQSLFGQQLSPDVKASPSSSHGQFSRSNSVPSSTKPKFRISEKNAKENEDNSMEISLVNQQASPVTQKKLSRSTTMPTAPVEASVPMEQNVNKMQSSSSSNSKSSSESCGVVYGSSKGEQSDISRTENNRISKSAADSRRNSFPVQLSSPAIFKVPCRSFTVPSVQVRPSVYNRPNPNYNDVGFKEPAKRPIYIDELHERRNQLRKIRPKIIDDRIVEAPDQVSIKMRNGFTYFLDDKSRVFRVFGLIHEAKTPEMEAIRQKLATDNRAAHVRLPRRQFVQALGGNNKYVAGHIIGHQFCQRQQFHLESCDDPLNLVPMHEKLNNGQYKRLENLLRFNSRSSDVFVDILLRYDDSVNGLGSHVPASLTFEQYRVDGDKVPILLDSTMVKNVDPGKNFSEIPIRFSAPTILEQDECKETGRF